MHNVAGAKAHIENGLRAHRAGDFAGAISAYRQALAVAPDDPAGLNLLGTALVQIGQPADGVRYLEQAAARQRGEASVLGNLAQGYFALGRYADAREAFRRASRADPRVPQYQLGIANSLAMEGQLGEAEAMLKRIVQRFPNEPLGWFNYGNALRDQGRMAEALAPFARATDLAPEFVDARNNFAATLHALQRFDEAEREFRRCIAEAPRYLLPQCNLASLLIDRGRFGEAEALCRDALRTDPSLVVAHTYMAAALGHQGRLVDALRSYEAAAASEVSGQTVQAYAGALADVARYAGSMRSFCRALAYDPTSAVAHQVLGTVLLTRGCMTEGWEEYAWRPARQRLIAAHPDLHFEDKLREDLRGQHVCVLAEQGLGDELYFLRWTALLKERGARLTYRASNKIRSLLARASVADTVLGEDEPLPAADRHLLVGDLPRALSTLAASPTPVLPADSYTACMSDSPERIAVYWPPLPSPVALTPLEERLPELRERLAAAGPPPYIGLTWRAGTAPETQDASWVLYKECPLDGLAAVLARHRGTLIALQRKPAPGEIDRVAALMRRPVHDFTAYNEDLEGMLALLALLDDYVGVSNTNMHMRAGLGRMARVLVPCPPEWRWMGTGGRSPWFQGFRVYRQSLQGDWSAALHALDADLAAGRS